MKIIIGVFDRQISRKLAVVFSGRKILPIEAESIEEIPALMARHGEAVLLSEEISPEFYRKLKETSPSCEPFLLYRSTLSVEQITLLRSCGLRGLIPYSENSQAVADTLMKYLSLLAGSINKESRTLTPPKEDNRDAAVYLPPEKLWIYGRLEGFNGAKAAVSFRSEDMDRLRREGTSRLLLHLQGLRIKAEAEILYGKGGTVVFRFCSMGAEDHEKLSHYIRYCYSLQGVAAAL